MACGCGVMWGHVPSMTRSSAAVAPHSSSLSAPSCTPSRNRTHLSEARLTRVSSRPAWGPPAEGSRTAQRTRRRTRGRPPPLGGGRAAWSCRWRTRRAWAGLLRLRRGLTARRSRPSRAATSRRGGSSFVRQRRLVRNCVRVGVNVRTACAFGKVDSVRTRVVAYVSSGFSLIKTSC